MRMGLGFWGSKPATAAISIVPHEPGTIKQSSPGAGASWNCTVRTNFSDPFNWVVVEGVAPFAFRTSANKVTPNSNGETGITPHFVASGDFVKAWRDSNTNLAYDSGQVTLT